MQRLSSMQGNQQQHCSQSQQQAGPAEPEAAVSSSLPSQLSLGSTSSGSSDHSADLEGLISSGSSSPECVRDDHSSDGFVSSWASGGWLVDNPLGVPTEREHYVQVQGGKVFRVLLIKK
eukprot:GHUV01041865.1.p1 GENE.GHUV01041865.1~~GHUV01041865.1.p1  ORF type:complete len:140 (+),score=52.06 GHUV01041865.1:64-420(+)